MLAVEIHDAFSQLLGAAHLRSLSARNYLQQKDHCSADAAMENVLSLLDKSIRRVHDLTYLLKEEQILHPNLIIAIQNCCSVYEDEFGLVISFNTDVEELVLSKDHTFFIIRIIQEGLRNIALHAQARNAEVLIPMPEKNELIVRIQDDGKGIDLNKIENANSLGIWGMKYRAKKLNGLITYSKRKTIRHHSGYMCALKVKKNSSGIL